MEIKKFKIDLPGILNVLGENLYSNPNVAFREMIQNAHDGINRRIIEERNHSFFQNNSYKENLPKDILSAEEYPYGIPDLLSELDKFNTENQLSEDFDFERENYYKQYEDIPYYSDKDNSLNDYDLFQNDESFRYNINQHRINIITDKSESIIKISDNGSGLNKQEIEDFLATIGRGYTDVLKDSLDSSDDSYKLIGQFGLGFLAGFLIADKIEVHTKSINSDSGFIFIAEGNGYYSLDTVKKDEPGTDCILHLKPEFERFLEPEILRPIIHHYTCLLEHPIYLNYEQSPINDSFLPWKYLSSSQNDYEVFIEKFFKTESIGVIKLKEFKYKGELIPLEGFLFIPKYTVLSIGEFGSLLVYIRNMLITTKEKTILPDWAKFVTGIINCPVLEPSASREFLKNNEYSTIISEHLSELIIDYLKKLKLSEPISMTKISRNHNNLIKSWALINDDLFEVFNDVLLFSTNKGEMNLKKYISLSNEIFYINENQSTQQKMLTEFLNIPVIDLRYFGDENFVKKYALLNNYHLNNITYHVHSMLENSSAEIKEDSLNDNWLEIIAFYERKDYSVKLINLKNPNIPLLLDLNKENKLIEGLKENMVNLLIPEYMYDLIQFEISKSRENKKEVLFINHDSNIIRKIVSLQDDSKKEKLLESILKFSLIFSGDEKVYDKNIIEVFFEEFDGSFLA